MTRSYTGHYNPREAETIRRAVRIIARVHIDGSWREAPFTPDPALGETELRLPLQAVLARVRHALRHHRDLSRIVLYAEDTRGHRAALDHSTEVPELGTQA